MSLTKIGSIGINTGIQFAGVTTIATLNSSSNVLSVGGTVNFNSDVSIGGSVSIGGTLTYEDVTNVDSVGLITARSGISVSGGDIKVGSATTLSQDNIFTTGIITATSFDGALAASNLTGALPALDGSALTGIANTDVIFADKISLPDSTVGSINIGIGSDLQLYWDGNSGFVTNQGGGNLHFNSDTVLIKNAANSKSYIRAYNNSSVEIFHDNSKKFETASYGVLSAGQVRVASSNTASVAFSVGDVNTGFYNAGSHAIGYAAQGTQMWNIDSAGNLRFLDSVKATFGTDDDLKLYHDNSSNCYLEIHNDKQFHINASTGGSIENMAKFLPNSGVELFNNNVKKFAIGASGVYLDHTGTLGQHNIHFERGQSGDYTNIIGSTNYPDNSSYTDVDDNYWTFTSAKGGHVAIINSDGNYNSNRNDYDHFSIYQKANTETSNAGRRLFSVDNIGGVQFGLAGVRMDRGWDGQPSITMQRDCNDGVDNTDGSAYFRFHGSSATHKSWTGQSGGNTGGDFSCNILIDGSTYATSDRRAKTDIVDCPYGLDIVNKLQPRKFQLINSALEPQGDDNINLGFIAQEIMEHIPECVNYLGDEANTPNEKGHAKAYVFDSSEVIPVLTKAIQELSAKNDALEARINTLEG